MFGVGKKNDVSPRQASPPVGRSFGAKLPSASPPLSPRITMSPAMDCKMPQSFARGQRPSTSPVLVAQWESVMRPPGPNDKEKNFGRTLKAGPAASSMNISPSPALVPLDVNQFDMHQYDKRYDGKGGRVVVGLASVPTSVLCCPADKRRWSSLTISLQSSASQYSDHYRSEEEQSEDEWRAPGMVRSESFDSDDVDLVWSPSGRVCASNEAQEPFNFQTGFTFYFDPGKRKKGPKVKTAADYAQNLKTMAEVTNVQEFWRFWNSVDVENMPMGSDFSIFKRGLFPLWENPENEQGGRWIITGFRDEDAGRHLLNIVLTLVGLQFGSFQEMMNGVVLSTRKHGRSISLWNRWIDGSSFEPVDCSLRLLVEDLDVQIEFRSHNQAICNNLARQQEQEKDDKDEKTRWGPGEELEWRKANAPSVEQFDSWRSQNATWGGDGLQQAHQGYY